MGPTGPQPIGSRVRNACVDGLREAYESAVAALLLALRVIPVLALWAVLLWWPARTLFRMVRAREASGRA